MTRKLGILTVRGKTYHPTQRLAEAALKHDVAVVPINPYHILPAYADNSPGLHNLPAPSELLAVLPRQGAEIKTACLPLIAQLEQMGVRIINGLKAIQIARNKFFMLQALNHRGLPVPDTLFATSMEGCEQARQLLAPHPAVLKPISGRQGTGIHCVPVDAPIPTDVEMEMTMGRGLLVQEFIPPQGRLDYRVMVIGNTVAGAMTLTPPEGEFRSNAHIGSHPEKAHLNPDMADLAVRAARATSLEIAGVDIMVTPQGEAMVTEVNSAPGFRALEDSTGQDIAAGMIDYVLSVCQA